MKLIQTHAMISRTRATKNELVMDLAKTKAQVAQVREKPTRLQFIGGIQDLHKRHHLQNFHRSCVTYKRYGIEALSFYFHFFDSFLFYFSLLFSFSLFASHFACQQELYQLAHTRFARNTTRYQVCKAQAIID